MSEWGGDPVLVAITVAKGAERFATLDQETRLSEFMDALRLSTGREVPTPLEVVTSDWQNDPFSRGSYSFLRVGSSYEDRAALAAPESERILFAGECTNVERPSTVDGALMSGIREARRLTGLEEIWL